MRYSCECFTKFMRMSFYLFSGNSVDNRGIKHDFPFINIRKVPREVLKTEGEARGFQPSRGTLRKLMNDKIMFDRYYCINSTKHCENEEKIGALVTNIIKSRASTKEFPD